MQIKEKQIIKNNRDTNIRNIYCRLIKPESLGKNLDNIPHEKVLDIALVFYIRVNIISDEYLSIMINNALMQSMGMNSAQLKKIAWSNTLRDNPPVFKSLKKELGELGLEFDEKKRQVYIISNEKSYLGAVSIIYPGLLEMIRSSIGKEFYILPASVHECLAVPCDPDLPGQKLREIVREINHSQLKERDILSDSVYRYSSARGRLIIDNL